MIEVIRPIQGKTVTSNYWGYLIITISVIIAYWPTFTGGFILDDNRLIKNNPYVRELHSISSYFSQEDGIIHEKDLGIYHTGYYRPLINLTYWLDYKLWGMKAPGFRVTNLFLHLFNCFILMRLIILLVKDKRAAFWGTFLFALHPVNTESVSWIISRNNLLVTFFAFFSFYFYIIWWEKSSYAAGFASIISFLGAVFSKEFGLMVLPAVFLYHRCLSKKRDLFLEFIYYAPFIIVLIFYFFLRENVTGSFLTPIDNAQLWSRIYFAPFLIIWNLKLVFVPYGLHYFYLSYPSSLFNWQVVLSVGLFLLLGTVVWVKRNHKLLLFSGLSFLILIFPVLNIISSASTSVTLVAMRWLYLPLAFICPGLAWLIHKAFSSRAVLTTSFLVITIVYFGIYTNTLNKGLWHNEDIFFRQEVLGFKNDFLAGDLAERLFNNGNYREAERYFRIALNKFPYQAAYHYINYSALLIETGRPDIAISYLNKAQPLTMTHHERGEWFNNMGMALLRKGKMEEALIKFKKSVVFAPGEGEFWANLGGVYGMMGDYKNSVNTLKKGIEISPKPIQLFTNLAMTYINMEDYHKAISTLEAIPSEKNKENVSRLLRLARERLSIE